VRVGLFSAGWTTPGQGKEVQPILQRYSVEARLASFNKEGGATFSMEQEHNTKHSKRDRRARRSGDQPFASHTLNPEPKMAVGGAMD
jgi:hypothetical protein